jgi:hypothetical protein
MKPVQASARAWGQIIGGSAIIRGELHRAPSALTPAHGARRSKKLKAAGELSEDGLHDLEAEVQKLTDRFVKSVDDHLKHKEAEIMKV